MDVVLRERSEPQIVDRKARDSGRCKAREWPVVLGTSKRRRNWEKKTGRARSGPDQERHWNGCVSMGGGEVCGL